MCPSETPFIQSALGFESVLIKLTNHAQSHHYADDTRLYATVKEPDTLDFLDAVKALFC